MTVAEEITNPKAEQVVLGIAAWARSQPTEVARAAAAKWALDTLAQASLDISQVRIEAVRGLWAEGWSLSDISEALGLSRARIHQIIEK
jgi:DNA-directed RNA polymerase specialized sigma24 family protein